MNHFDTSTLARLQDRAIYSIKRGKAISKWHYDQLRSNWYIKLANYLAPSNLTIRNDVILDITEGSKNRRDRISSHIGKLFNEGMWAEGYTYWLYTRDALKLIRTEWIWLSKIIDKTDISFIKTSYFRNGKLWPAPYGDLREYPIHRFIISAHPEIRPHYTISIGSITKTRSSFHERIYHIRPFTVGLNTHTVKNESIISITKGVPTPFIFYKGYDKKYKNKLEEIKDIFDPRRIFK